MKLTTGFGMAAATLALAGAPLFAETVRDSSFDQEVQVVSDELQRQQEVGMFGRAGDAEAAEGLPAGTVRDRDIDRYVERLGLELRMRNAIADSDAARMP